MTTCLQKQTALGPLSRSCRLMSTKLQTGIVGLPNVGKSTLFNALVGSQVAAAENYPFCTIEPNVGIVSGASLIANFAVYFDSDYHSTG